MGGGNLSPPLILRRFMQEQEDTEIKRSRGRPRVTTTQNIYKEPEEKEEEVVKEIVEQRVPKVLKKEQKARVIFHNSENPGKDWNISYELENFSFKDDEEYTLPLTMVETLNKCCKIPIRSDAKVNKGGMPLKTGRSTTRIYFEIIERL